MSFAEMQDASTKNWNSQEPTVRPPSVNLLDMTDVLSIEPNTNQIKSITNDLLDKKNSMEGEEEEEKKKIIKMSSLQKFDPLQQRNSTVEKEKVIPTRLPTPRRPMLTSHVSSDRITVNNELVNIDPVQLTPPSSPGKRIRHTSIARLVKPPTSLGKANRDLAEFDPLISPVKKNYCSTSSNSTTKKGIQIESNIKQEKMETKIPLPPTRQIIKDEIPKEDSPLATSKLRKPEVIVPKSIKLISLPRKEITVNYSRRPSYPTAANEILQEQWDKERETSRRLSANLISATGLISQPEDDASFVVPPLLTRTLSHESRMEKIHDRLQCLVDVGTVEEEPVITDYKREHGNTEVMSPKTALNRYRPYLSPFEKTEIMRYPAIYCVGSHAKKNQASTDQTALNYGYDDDKGDYQIIIKDHLNYRYEIVESLGKGSFGQVVKCKDHKPPSTITDPISSNLVAIKIIRNKKRFHAQAQTEVKILEKIMSWDPKNKHYNVKMLDSFYFRDHLCIVFECLSLNLYEILQQNSYQGFSMGLVKRFAYQILTALKLLSEHNVIHCDLKPENILLKQPDRSGIRVIDYGSSCFVNEKVYTYIQSRFYRAPEVILGMDYGLPIDMWSTGCILAELYTGKALFPGENEPDQLACIMQLIGVPDKHYLERCSRKKQFFDMYDQPKKSINSKGKKRRPNSLTFTDALRRAKHDTFDRDFGDFISRCLTWEPEGRMKPVQALNHPWVQAMKK